MRLSSLAFVLVLCCTSPASADDYVFRKVKWGMTAEEVKQLEKQQGDSLFVGGQRPSAWNGYSNADTYTTNMFGVKVGITYGFPENCNGLSSVAIVIPPNCLKANSKQGCLDGVNKMLIQKYGSPLIKHNDQVKSDHVGKQIINQNMSAWALDDKVIISQLTAMSFTKNSQPETHVLIVYYAPDYYEKLVPSQWLDCDI